MQIIEYESRFQRVFKRLNVDWIQTHWQLEAADHQVLDDPERYILGPGAINLYRKLGFVEFVGEPSLYERCNIQMVLDLRSPIGY